MKKRSDRNPRKRSQASHNQFLPSNSHQPSDLINTNRVKLKEAETEAKYASVVQYDAPEIPQSSSDAKTSEYAFFKRLKQDVGRTSRVNSVNKESIPTRSLRPNNTLRELGGSKYRDVQSSLYANKSKTDDIGYFSSPKHAAFENLDKTSNIHGDHGTYKSSVIFRTPTNIDLHSFLSLNTDASPKPKTQRKDQDIFSFKREKLKQQIANTLFPEADELPKECDVVSLLLHRLLPKSCGNSLENLNSRQGKIEEESQLYCFPNPNIQVEEKWETSRQFSEAEDGYFLGNRASAVWSQKFKERLPPCDPIEDIECTEVRHDSKMLPGYSRNDEIWSLDDVDYKPWASRIGDRNLLMWRNESYDCSTKSWSKIFQDWKNDDFYYSNPCNTNTELMSHIVHDQFSHDGLGSLHLYKFSSYQNPNALYGSVTTGITRRDEQPEYDVNNVAALSCDSWGDSWRHFMDYAQPNYSYDLENRRESQPLLLDWDTSEIQDSTHANLELALYNPSSSSCQNHLLSLESSNLMGIHSSSFSSGYKFQDHTVQKCAPLPLSYVSSEELNPNDDALLNNIFKHSSGLKVTFLNGLSETENDISTDALYLQRQENPSLKFLLENGNENISRQEEDWPLMNDVSIPLKLHEVRWLEGESETYYDERTAMSNYL